MPARSDAAASAGRVAGPEALFFTADPEANRLLAQEPLAVLIGMLLDQQVTMEWAFGAPLLLKRRLGVDHLDASAIAAMDPAALDALFRAKPALHRYPGSMAKRTHDLCTYIVDNYDGRTEAIWTGAATGEELRRAARQAARRAAARLGEGRGRLGVDRRRRLLRPHHGDPREEAGGEGGQEGRQEPGAEEPHEDSS
jgi:hypothetical protein